VTPLLIAAAIAWQLAGLGVDRPPEHAARTLVAAEGAVSWQYETGG